MPFLHAHRRRVPAQDVDRGIVVGVGSETAMLTDKACLAFAALPVHGSAFRTGLRGIGGIDLAKAPPAFFELVGKKGLEAKPPLIEDRAIQPGFLPDHAARFFDGSARGSCHVFDAEVFENDRSEAPRHVERSFVRPILADAGSAAGEFRGASQCLGATDGAALAPRRNPLCGAMAPLDGFERTGNGKPLARGQRQRVGDTAVDADSRANIDRRNMFDFAGEADMPAKRVERDGSVFERPAHGARVAELHPADFWQAHGGPFAINPSRLDLAALKAEAVVDVLLARRRITGDALEEISESFVEIAQGLLLACLRDGSNPVVFSSKGGQFVGLCDIIEPLAHPPLIMSPPVATLLKSEIIDQAAYSSELPEQCFLFDGWTQLVSEAAKDHSAKLAVGPAERNMSENADIRRGRHVIYALHAHLVFVTKYRKDALSELAIRDLRAIFAKVCKDFDAELIECNGEDDHVHLLIAYPPKVALSKLVNSLKGVSSRLLREWRPEVRGRYKDGVLWSPSYFVASCGGAPLSIVAEYVKSQREAPVGRSRLPPRPEGRGFSRGPR